MKTKTSKVKVISFCLVALTILSGFLLSRIPSRANADTVDAVDDVSVVVGAACSLSASVTPHTATVTPGETVSDIGSTTITVSCNDVNGWALYAVGFGEDVQGGTNLTMTSGSTSYTIPTGTSGNNSYWAMKLAAAGETSSEAIVSGFEAYHSVPNTLTKVASLPQDTAATAGSSVSTTYQTHSSSDQIAGTYTGKVKYMLVHPSSAVTCPESQGLSTTTTCDILREVTVEFVGDGANYISFTSPVNFETQTVTTTGENKVNLVDGVTYTVTTGLAPGYFIKSQTATNGTILSSTENPSAYIPSTGPATYTITAQRPCNPSATTITDAVCLQDINASIKDSMVASTLYYLVDSRDGEKYTVAKLADNQIWMLDNLRLGGINAISLTSSDTNIASDWTLPASGTWTSATQDSYTTPYINASSKNMTISSYGEGSGKIGAYYNYCAASAGTVCAAVNSNNATHDICPKGWRMPIGGNGGEYNTLYISYGSDATNFRAALSTPLSGYFHSGVVTDQVTANYSWSSTRNSNTNMFSLTAGTSSVNPANNGDRSYGYSVRCLAQ